MLATRQERLHSLHPARPRIPLGGRVLDVRPDDQLLVGLKVHADTNCKLGKPLEELLLVQFGRLLEADTAALAARARVVAWASDRECLLSAATSSAHAPR